MQDFNRIATDVRLGRDVKIFGFANLYGCSIGDETRIGPFVEIQRGVTVGSRCKVQSHTFVCTGVTIEDDVFVGHGVLFGPGDDFLFGLGGDFLFRLFHEDS